MSVCTEAGKRGTCSGSKRHSDGCSTGTRLNRCTGMRAQGPKMAKKFVGDQ